ncbi:MAG: GTPase Era [Burkholderiales bacterium]|nr:GTPase Era [Burkholderiales bacterium]
MSDTTSMPSEKETTRCGFIALVGRPSVGKSTLLNRLLGAKISITSSKPQTTRQRITGVLTEGANQFLFVDTPGFQTKHKSALNKRMNQAVRDALAEVDVVVALFDAVRHTDADETLLSLLPTNEKTDKPVIAVLNKVDLLADKTALLPRLDALSKRHPFAALIPLSAEKGMQVDALKTEMAKHLPAMPWLYPQDELTDRDERFLAAEFIREKIFRLLGDEIPYSTHVVVETFELEGNSEHSLRRIQARVYVERDSQRAILLGHQGQTMKRIATEARQEMERLFGGKVYLVVLVQVKPGWKDNPRTLQHMGL